MLVCWLDNQQENESGSCNESQLRRRQAKWKQEEIKRGACDVPFDLLLINVICVMNVKMNRLCLPLASC